MLPRAARPRRRAALGLAARCCQRAGAEEGGRAAPRPRRTQASSPQRRTRGAGAAAAAAEDRGVVTTGDAPRLWRVPRGGPRVLGERDPSGRRAAGRSLARRPASNERNETTVARRGKEGRVEECNQGRAAEEEDRGEVAPRRAAPRCDGPAD
eukprot:scaffold165_cov265-Prasinococcus_capsulatus_cf.AAC.3